MLQTSNLLLLASLTRLAVLAGSIVSDTLGKEEGLIYFGEQSCGGHDYLDQQQLRVFPHPDLLCMAYTYMWVIYGRCILHTWNLTGR